MVGVALDCLKVVQFKVADAAVVKLDGLLLELGALVRVDAEIVIIAAVFVAMFLEA